MPRDGGGAVNLHLTKQFGNFPTRRAVGCILLPHGIQRLGAGSISNSARRVGAVDIDVCTRLVSAVPIGILPALKGMALASGDISAGDLKHLILCTGLLGDVGKRAGAAVSVKLQNKGTLSGGIGILRNEVNGSALIAGGRTALVKRPRCGIRVGFFRPTDDLVTAVDRSAVCGSLDIRNRDRVVRGCGVGVICCVLANKLGLFGRTVVVANVKFAAYVQDGESDIDLMPGVQSGGSYIGSGNRQHGQCASTGHDRVPLGGIGGLCRPLRRFALGLLRLLGRFAFGLLRLLGCFAFGLLRLLGRFAFGLLDLVLLRLHHNGLLFHIPLRERSGGKHGANHHDG